MKLSLKKRNEETCHLIFFCYTLHTFGDLFFYGEVCSYYITPIILNYSPLPTCRADYGPVRMVPPHRAHNIRGPNMFKRYMYILYINLL
ncbi:hypothetical protein HanXRQr2_Chr17g0804031 [Helianthus annuus]|uniref:Uncharacterized protein n=1 Tax=Helianthus annuus TaxID=4232 RepID=A0A9K3DHM4_HELAN|nr:hypothetical protein HanXRQr2_Chr17g0804031 [Helianthus annuus]KAJ0813281.1 hypothetical protein HanPSC8_Chr17g0771611 [Helianthus annuus]